MWDKRLGGAGFDQLTSLITTANGGFLLGGTSDSPAGMEKTQASNGKDDFWIIKLRKDGTKEWDITQGNNQDDWLSAVVQTSDGGYLLGGNSQRGAGDNDWWVVKLNPDGKQVWDKPFRTSGDDHLTTIALNQQQVLLGGSTDGKQDGDKTELLRAGLIFG